LLPKKFASLTQKYWRAYLHSRISLKPPSPQETEHEKKKEKEKLQESFQIKGEVNVLRGEKQFNFKIHF
jgi:hypothetical protein